MPEGLDPASRAGEWRRRPLLSLLLRAGVVALPALAALGVALLLSRTLPHPAGLSGTLLWWASISAAILITVLAMERAARRLLPLAGLLNVSLLFPDRAPQRFATARRMGSPRELRHEMEELQLRSPGSSEVDHMQRVLVLAAALSFHDHLTRGHAERVRIFTDLIAVEMRLSEHDRARLRWASLLHDIGKLLVPAEVLSKPGALDPREWEVIKRHPDDGATLIAPIRGWLGPWADAVGQHH